MRMNVCLSSLLGTALLLAGVAFQVNAQEKTDFNATYGQGEQVLRIATGSPGSLGLLKEISLDFCNENDCRIKWLKCGSGASLRALKEALVDVVMVHAPEVEKEAVRQGWAINRVLLGCNQFFIVGPSSDPAEIRTADSASEAYAKIAKAKEFFLSRSDDSGTHKKEMDIWEKADTEPQGDWYIKTNDFMGPTLLKTDELSGYFMTDSSTFLVKKSRLKNLTVLFKDDPILMNVYHALMANPQKLPNTNDALARKFLRYVGFGPGQEVYRSFGLERYGKPLYEDAFQALKYDE
jgi:tungstate transport system substrate-binding protein